MLKIMGKKILTILRRKFFIYLNLCYSIVDRGADGVQVIFWYHRQFVEAAEARYCQGETSQKLHAALADYFGGSWANGEHDN